jgi:putative glycosyl hydrolase-like family 15 (GHL15) protein
MLGTTLRKPSTLHKRITGFSVIVSVVLLVAQLGFTGTEQGSAGKVRFLLRIDPSIDPFVGSGNAADELWIRTHWWRMMVYSTWFDKKTRWYPGGLLYKDCSGIYLKQQDLLSQHPDWVLKDDAGNRLFVQYNCKPDQKICSHYAADVGNPAYRRWWIGEARDVISRGYKGLWIDDVNMSWRISNGEGLFVNPVDPRTGRLMSEDDWRRYLAEFMEEVRTELPDIDIVHNAIWFAGPDGVRDRDPFIQREYRAADYINNEHGVYGNEGMRGGTGKWSYQVRLEYYDRVHSLGKGVIIDEVAPESNTPQGREFTLATYFLISTGRDAVGNQKIHNSSEWWSGYDVDLGEPMAARKSWNGLYRRDYSSGMVLVNPPESAPRSVSLTSPLLTVDGARVTSLTLTAKQGIVLRNP